MTAPRAESIKLWSVRSAWLALGVAVAVTVGLGRGRHGRRRARLGQDASRRPGRLGPPASALARLPFAQLALGVLGVLAVTSEYSSGTILATPTAGWWASDWARCCGIRPAPPRR
jgi:ABC-2 type transport system permease protein